MPSEGAPGCPQSPDLYAGGTQPYRVLGYNNGVFYYFPRAKKQVVALTPSGHTANNLMQLAALDYWLALYPEAKGDLKKMVPLAANDLISAALKAGVFHQEATLRGSGCWLDEGRVVMHCGNDLYINCEHVGIENIESVHTYVASVRLVSPAEPLDNHEAYAFRRLCCMPTWENDLSGTLLAGFCMVAPFCGALDFRPHIYLTGESDSGKSTVMEMIVKPALGKMALRVDGGTTEPAIRQLLGYDARPLVFDEAEGEHGRETMRGVIELARKASTRAVVIKYGQKPFTSQFCGMFSAINPPVNKIADENRFAFLVLRRNTAPDAMQHYDDFLVRVSEVITEDFSERLLSRTLGNFMTLRANIKTFTRAARIVLKAARAAQVLGTLLAGAYLLNSTKEITPADAEEWIKQHKWDDYMPAREDNDPMRLVQHISSAMVRYSPAVGDITIGELIGKVFDSDDETSDMILRRHSIKVSDGWVTIGDKGQNLAKILKDTDWEKRWGRTLSSVPGAQKVSNTYFMAALKTNGTRLPIELFKEEK